MAPLEHGSRPEGRADARRGLRPRPARSPARGGGSAGAGGGRDPGQVAWLNALARRLQLPLDAAFVDLEQDGVDLGEAEWELVLVFNYLHRPLFPALVRALKPGGMLLYETYTTDQAKRGRPATPAHLLEPGELPGLVAPLEVVRHREGEVDGRAVASVAARKTGPGLA